MLAYHLRHRIDFQQRVTTQNPTTLETTESWAAATLADGTVLTGVPARVLTGPGNERVISQGERAQGVARINVRWFPATREQLTSWRILWDGRVYNISSAEQDATARREWRLICEDGVNNG